MINASEAYKRSSEAHDSIAQKKLKEFKKEADMCITNAINSGRWSCYILCDCRARDLATQWLKTYGYRIDEDLAFLDNDSIYVSWRDAESSLRGE